MAGLVRGSLKRTRAERGLPDPLALSKGRPHTDVYSHRTKDLEQGM